MWVSGLPVRWGVSEIAAYFQGQSLKSVNLIKTNEGERTGRAIFTYDSTIDAENAIKEYNGKNDLELMPFKGKIPNPEVKMFGKQETLGSWLSRRVVLFNLPNTFSEDNVHILLAGVGKILEIDIPKLPNGKIKGYALIYMDKVKDVTAAIEVLNNLKFENSTLRASNKLTDTA